MAAVKRSKPSDDDRISNLPGHIISQILSLLSTEEAVATSVLSTKWKFLWTSITDLDFDNEEVGYEDEKKVHKMKAVKFTHFVNRVLLLLNPPFIKSFRLNFIDEICDPFYLSSWICAAVGRNARELDLNVALEVETSLELPLTQSFCNTLTVLKLGGYVDFNIHTSASVCFSSLQSLDLNETTLTIARDSSVSFPNLNKMVLQSVVYANEDSVHKLLASCPVLHELTILGGYWDNVSCLIICIPSLIRLTLDVTYDHHYQLPDLFKLQIDTPALQYLFLGDRSWHKKLSHLPIGSFSSLVEAKVQFNFNVGMMGFELFDNAELLYSISVCKLLGQLSRVKSLSLLGQSVEAVMTAPINIFPAFHNLKWVEFEQYNFQDWHVVVDTLLQSMDNLEHLVLKKGMCFGSRESWWIEPVNVPKCLRCRVTYIHFTNMNNCRDELELSRYFLKNAKVLRLLKIDSDHSLTTKFKMFQKISMFPRGSDACKVAFK